MVDPEDAQDTAVPQNAADEKNVCMDEGDKLAAEQPAEADMLATIPASDGERADSGIDSEPPREIPEQTVGQPSTDEAGAVQADLAKGLAQNVVHSCPCKVCCHPVALYAQAPFEYWACDLCDRSFLRSDSMMGCPTAQKCDWGICMDCYGRLQNRSEPGDHAETPDPFESQTASNGFPPLLAGAIGAALIGPPIITLPLLLAATRHGWTCRRS